MNKTMLISLFMLLFGTVIQAQVKIGENGSPTKGALLDLNGTYKGGLLLPNVAITNLGTIPAGFTERGGADKAADLTGMIVWSTDPVNSGLYMWDGDNWQSLMCNEKIAPCTGPAPAPTAITIPAGPFANGETFEVSCTATEDGTTFYIWTAPTGLSITAGQGTKTIRVSGTAGAFDKNKFTVFAVNQCAQSATVNGGTGQITVTAALANGAPPSTTVEIPTGGNTELDAGAITGGNCASYSYQWQKLNGSVWEDISGATSVKYRTPNLTTDTQYKRITTCGTETATSATITVTIKQVTEPNSVTASPLSIYTGGSTTLSYDGGSGTTFEWYTVDCGDTQVATGQNQSVSPTTTTTYWGRWESGNSYSDCKSVTVTVNKNPETLPDGSGSFAGRTCFDVAQANGGECGDLTSRQNETLSANGARADFSNTLTRNQAYTFTTSGIVSKVRFYAVEADGYTGQIIESISGNNSGNSIASGTAITCNVVYKSDLNGKASGKTTANALTATIYVVYNNKADSTGNDEKKKLVVSIKDCACCGAYTTSGTWLPFMCYNLGADPSLISPDQIKAAATSKTNGDYYQWGKKTPGWVVGGGNTSDAAWGYGTSKNTTYDPCPQGWRVPSMAQWMSIFNGGTTYANPGYATANIWTYSASSSPGFQVGDYLYLPMSGTIGYDGTTTASPALNGMYWTSDASINVNLTFAFNPNAVGPFAPGSNKNSALPIRCIIE